MKPVEIIGGRAHRYNIDFIFNFLSGAPEGTVVPPPISSGEPGLPPAEPARPQAPVFVVPKWRENETREQRATRIRTSLTNLRDPEKRELFSHVLAGRSFAQPGKRDASLNLVASVIAFIAPEAGADELLDFLKPSLAFMKAEADDPGNPALTEDDALCKLDRKLIQAREKHAIRQQVEDRIRSTLIKAARTTTPSSDDIGEEEEEASTEYTPAELDAFAAAQDCSPEEFARRWVIQRGTSYYIYCRGVYLTPLQKDELDVSLDRDLAPVPSQGHPAAIDWHTFNKDGSIRKKKVAEILKDYSTVARDTVADLTLKHSYYDPATQIFHEAACPLRDIPARYDEHVDGWLRVLAGEQYEKMADWIATVPNLKRQTCAIYMSGPKGVGKSLFATGLARLWTADGSPTELGKILENFNADLLHCPLIFADEYIPQNFKGQRTSAELRQLIGSNARTLARKFLPNATLVGAVRLIMAANNERLLALDEDLSKDDLEAVGQRFLHIETTTAASDYLKKIGGRNGTEGWVDGDKIAMHAMWLAKTRNVIPGDRFLVEGHRTKLHTSLPTQSKINGLIVEWLVRFLDAPPAIRHGIEQSGLVLVGGGEYLVNTQALADNWMQFIKSDMPPSTGRIGRAVRTLSTGPKSVFESRYLNINLDVVFDWATEQQIGKEAQMKALVARPLTDSELAPVKRQMMKVVQGGKDAKDSPGTTEVVKKEA